MQTNVQHGEKVFAAMADLDGKEGYLVKLAGPNAHPAVNLPASATDVVQFVLTDCNKGIGAHVSALPLSPDWNVRVWLTGTCSIGDRLVLDPNDGTPNGKVTKLPSTAGNYRVVGIAEENGVDGQCVLLRPFNELVTVTE